MRKRHLKKKIKKELGWQVDDSIEFHRLHCRCFVLFDRCHLTKEPWSIMTDAVLLDPNDKRQVKEFKREVSALRLRLLKKAYFQMTCVEISDQYPLTIQEVTDRYGRVEDWFGFEKRMLRLINQSEKTKIIDMTLLIQQNINYLWVKKKAAPNLLSLMIFSKWTEGCHSSAILNLAMDDAYSRYIDKKVRLNDKLADIDLEFLVLFRKALRLLLQSGALSRTIFNTIWETDTLRSKLALPENGSFSYLPIMSPNRRIP